MRSTASPTVEYTPPANEQTSTYVLPGIALRDGFRFREGQQIFLEKLTVALKGGETNHLGVFVPGYGKTIAALASFVIAHRLGMAKKLVVFVPRGNLRDQYADTSELSRLFHNIGAPAFSFCVADSERVFLKNLDTQIIITTYQYASGRGGHKALLKFCHSAPCMFVFDEVHHLSDDGTWARKIQQFPFACSVALSGTPLRSDNKTLFGVPFEVREDGNQYYRALHEVNMRDAHAEGRILKRVKAHVVDYRLKMVRQDTGEMVDMSLSKLVELSRNKSDIDAYLARRKLRFHEVYLENLLRPAFDRYAEKRARQERDLARQRRRIGVGARGHQMLIIGMSNRHAAAILDFVERHFPQYTSARIGQDVPAAERLELLEAYRNGDIDVMVQVDMIGEGTDIKPISVIVKADLVRAYSKTIQQIFRGMRWFDDFSEENNVCDIYAADDSEVVEVLDFITSEEQIGIRMKQKRNGEAPPPGSSEASKWELTEVHHRHLQTHNLELFPEYVQQSQDAEPVASKPVTVDPSPKPDPAPEVVDVNQQEKDLRKACASLAAQLAHASRSIGRPVEIRTVHAEWKRRYSRGQDNLSVVELQRKRDWLEKCLTAGRIV